MPRFSLVVLTLVLALATGARDALGQDVPAAPSASQAVVGNVSRAPVVIDGYQLFIVRGITAYPAEQRARELEDRIEALAADGSVSTSSLTLEEQQGLVWILAGGQRVMAVLQEDASLEQIELGRLAEVYQGRIRNAVDAYRRDREPARLWRSALYALGATLVLLAAAYAGRRIVGRMRASLERRYEARIQDVQIQAFQIVKAKQIWRFLTGALNLVWVIGVLAILFVYLRYALDLFPWTRGLANSLVAIVIDPLRTMAVGLLAEVPNLVFLVVLIVIVRYVLKMVRLFFHGLDSGTVTLPEFDPEWAWPTYRLVRLAILALTVVVAYPYVPGSDSDAFKGVSLFIGVIFSLGSSSLIGNVIAGYSMTYRRAFKIGDRVKIGSYVGEVVRMRLLVTHLRTPKNEEVIVPNSAILAAEVVNYNTMARERGLILHTTVGIGYETPWRQVEAMLVEAASRTPGLLREPPPFVLQKALGDFSVTYEINAYCNTPETMQALYTALHRNILDVFNEYGVQIMTPAYEGDPEQPKVVPKAHWYTAPARR
jgi:small-conductance mechanosensitive channel